MVYKTLLFSILIGSTCLNFASEDEAAKKPTPVIIAGIHAQHESKPVFLGADKLQFLAQQHDGTMELISRKNAHRVMQNTTGHQWTKLEDIVRILNEHTRTMHDHLDSLLLSNQVKIFHQEQDKKQ